MYGQHAAMYADGQTNLYFLSVVELSPLLRAAGAVTKPHLLLVWRAWPEAREPQFRKNKQPRAAKTVSWGG